MLFWCSYFKTTNLTCWLGLLWGWAAVWWRIEDVALKQHDIFNCSIPLVASISSFHTCCTSFSGWKHSIFTWLMLHCTRSYTDGVNKVGVAERMTHDKGREPDNASYSPLCPRGTQERQFPMNCLRLLQHVQWLHHAEHDIWFLIFPARSSHARLNSICSY